MAKVRYVLDILILNGLDRWRCFFSLDFHLPSNFIRNWKIWKYILCKIFFYWSYEFCSHFHTFFPRDCDFERNTTIHLTFFCIVVLHVKFQPQGTKCVETRAKSELKVKIIVFFNVFFLFFNFWSNLRADKKTNWKITCIYRDHLYPNVQHMPHFCHMFWPI